MRARVAVIRDGRVRTMLEGEALTEEAIAKLVVVGTGQARRAPRRKPRRRPAAPLFSVRDWSHGSEFGDVDFDARRGEIVALMGVEGSGARELLRSFAGLERCTGAIRVDGVDGARLYRGTRLRAGDARSKASTRISRWARISSSGSAAPRSPAPAWR